MSRRVRTRFAPSPTGYLHIGGARTALFAWAYARQQQGDFLLRIEDTDSARSSDAHSAAIIESLDWLALAPDDKPVFQSMHAEQQKQKINRLLDEGKAYYCYATPEELTALREAQLKAGKQPKYDRRWRDSGKPPPVGVQPAVRFKMPLEGETTFSDVVKGELTTANSELDDFIIARADGSPTYNLAVVSDDIDMDISHIIRGDDHVMNTYRQWHLFAALAEEIPAFAHLPMIFSPVRDAAGAVVSDETGKTRYARMSKRHAAVDIGIYRRDGFLPQALCNYLARLSWSCGDAEVFSRDFFIENFSFAAISQSPARFDMAKLSWLNRDYLRQLPLAELRQQAGIPPAVADEAVALVRERAETLTQVKEALDYFITPPPPLAIDAIDTDHRAAFTALAAALAALPAWDAGAVKECIKQTAAAEQLAFKHLGMPLRLALTGGTNSPDIAAVAAVLGRNETLARLPKLL